MSVLSVCDCMNVMCVKVPDLHSLGCGVFYLQHPWPRLPGPCSVITTRVSGRAALPPLHLLPRPLVSCQS